MNTLKNQLQEFAENNVTSEVYIDLGSFNDRNSQFLKTGLSKKCFEKYKDKVDNLLKGQNEKNVYTVYYYQNLELLSRDGENKCFENVYEDFHFLDFCLKEEQETINGFRLKTVRKRPIDPIEFPSFDKYPKVDEVREIKYSFPYYEKNEYNQISIIFKKIGNQYHITLKLWAGKDNLNTIGKYLGNLINILFNKSGSNIEVKRSHSSGSKIKPKNKKRSTSEHTSSKPKRSRR